VSFGRYHDVEPSAGLVTTSVQTRTSNEQLSWQLRATRVLADLLRLAIREGLPGIAWTVSDVGMKLVGRCYGQTGAERRRDFQAWYAKVGATPRPEFTDAGGVTRLLAVASRYDGLIDIVVVAEVYPGDEGEADR